MSSSFSVFSAPFSSPEPFVSWSRGLETRVSGSSRYRMSENFWHPVTHVQKLQISLLMLITDFCLSPHILVPRARRFLVTCSFKLSPVALGMRMFQPFFRFDWRLVGRRISDWILKDCHPSLFEVFYPWILDQESLHHCPHWVAFAHIGIWWENPPRPSSPLPTPAPRTRGCCWWFKPDAVVAVAFAKLWQK